MDDVTGCAMTRNRYVLWNTVFEWLQNTDRNEVMSKERWNEIYHLLDRLMQEERSAAKPGELEAHARATGKRLIQ
jgi:hypothetical protein